VSGGTCRHWEHGSCGHAGIFEDRLVELAAAGVEWEGAVEVAEIGGMSVELYGIYDGLYALWDCRGHLRGIFAKRNGGGWIAHDPAEYRERFSLVRVLGS
jgi:hypothetical protein